MGFVEDLQEAAARVLTQAGPAVVRIGRGWGRGSGFVVRDGIVVTNAHNLRGPETTVTFADGRVATPALTGSILEGVTRSSIITLLREEGREVDEGSIRLDELQAGLASGAIAELFACGTAAVVTPVGRLAGEDFDLTVGDGGTGAVTAAVRARLTDIQYGRAADPHGWLYRLA